MSLPIAASSQATAHFKALVDRHAAKAGFRRCVIDLSGDTSAPVPPFKRRRARHGPVVDLTEDAPPVAHWSTMVSPEARACGTYDDTYEEDPDLFEAGYESE